MLPFINMAYVYRYKDMWTNEIHYVGIVWSKTRTLSTRISEHYKNDEWCRDGCYIVEILDVPIDTRTDAEYYEAHYISLYDTGKFYNKSKVNMGVSNLIPDNEDKWEFYGISFPMSKENKHKYNNAYKDIKNKSNMDSFDYFYISINSEDGYDAVFYKTQKRESSYNDVYEIFEKNIPENYGSFYVEQLETITDLVSKIFLGGISIDDIIEEESIYCDPFGDKLLSCCIPLKSEKVNGVRYISVMEAMC